MTHTERITGWTCMQTGVSLKLWKMSLQCMLIGLDRTLPLNGKLMDFFGLLPNICTQKYIP